MYQRIVLLSIIISLYGFSNQQFKKSSDINHVINIDTTQTPLVIYGAQIFKENKCLMCHKLTNDGKARLKSLDGLGGKFPDIWLYGFLQDPKSYIPKTRMRSFKSLFEKELSKNRYEKILQQNSQLYTAEQLEVAWHNLNEEVDGIKTGLQKELKKDAEVIPSEGLALMAYLQNIPSSKP